MLSSIANWVEDKATGLLRTGIQAGGTLAGNAVGGVGTLVENAGNSAGQTVSGSIGGVGGTINGYGEGIKRSMSADGPVSSAQKKTAVKPSTQSVKKPAMAQKSLPLAAGGPKTSPNAQKGSTASRPAKPAQIGSVRSKTIGIGKPVSNARSAQSNARAVPASDGKVRISPESRPGARKAPTTASTPKHNAKDPLGIGSNIGDVSKTRSAKPGSGKPPAAPSRKPTAGDPLALGKEIEKIGKRK